MKKRLSICLCLVLALSLLAGCGAQKEPAAAPTAEGPAVGLPNPVRSSSSGTDIPACILIMPSADLESVSAASEMGTRSLMRSSPSSTASMTSR